MKSKRAKKLKVSFCLELYFIQRFSPFNLRKKLMAQSRKIFSLQYFYLLTEQGHLYHLFDPLPFIKNGKTPSGPAFLRNEKFLDFFFKNLHPTPPELPHAKLFPFVSR